MSNCVEISVDGLPEGYVILDQIVLLKVLDPGGKVVFREHYGTSLNMMERLGMVTSATETVNAYIGRDTRPGD